MLDTLHVGAGHTIQFDRRHALGLGLRQLAVAVRVEIRLHVVAEGLGREVGLVDLHRVGVGLDGRGLFLRGDRIRVGGDLQGLRRGFVDGQLGLLEDHFLRRGESGAQGQQSQQA